MRAPSPEIGHNPPGLHWLPRLALLYLILSLKLFINIYMCSVLVCASTHVCVRAGGVREKLEAVGSLLLTVGSESWTRHHI